MFDDDQFFDDFISNRGKMLQLIFRTLNPENSFSVIHMGFAIAFKYVCPKAYSRIAEIVEHHEIIDCLFEHLMNQVDTSFSKDALRCLSRIVEFGAETTMFKLIENGFLDSFQKVLDRSNLDSALEMIAALMTTSHIICAAAFQKEIGTKEIIAACYHQSTKTVNDGVELLLKICRKLPDPLLTEFMTSGAGFALKDAFLTIRTEAETSNVPKLNSFAVLFEDTRLQKMAPILGLSELINHKFTFFENKG
uniref:Uncharacterized protein n=1 Tax=Panagrolaimus sp. JU765 TaxID=591449 RepID=A0AC34QGJ3_9BILA